MNRKETKISKDIKINKKSARKNYSNQAGITLIALVVTIVVLLILAGVSLNAIFSDSGIIQKAKDAQTKADEATQKDLEGIDSLDQLVNKYANGGTTGGKTELKAWVAIAKYMQSFDDTDGDGIANVPEYYSTTHDRKVVEDSRNIINLLKNIQKELGIAYLFIAHDLSMVKHISDRIGVMYLGHLVEEGDSKELYANPMHPYTKALMSAVPELDPAISKTKKPVMLQGDVPSPIDTPVGCKFASRCPYATKRCHEERPIFRNVGNEHYVACHLVE